MGVARLSRVRLALVARAAVRTCCQCLCSTATITAWTSSPTTICSTLTAPEWRKVTRPVSAWRTRTVKRVSLVVLYLDAALWSARPGQRAAFVHQAFLSGTNVQTLATRASRWAAGTCTATTSTASGSISPTSNLGTTFFRQAGKVPTLPHALLQHL